MNSAVGEAYTEELAQLFQQQGTLYDRCMHPLLSTGIVNIPR